MTLIIIIVLIFALDAAFVSSRNHRMRRRANQPKNRLEARSFQRTAERDAKMKARLAEIGSSMNPQPKQRQDMRDLDQLSGTEFEKCCADILRRNGFTNVQLTPTSGDQGVDILAEKNGMQYAIQCKRFSTKLGNSPVQEVNAGRSVYHCDRAIVMTNNYFTPGAVQAANACDVELWDRDDLYAMLAAFDDD